MKFLLPIALTLVMLLLCLLVGKILVTVWRDTLRPRGGAGPFEAFYDNRDMEPIARIEVYDSGSCAWPGKLVTQGATGPNGIARLEPPFVINDGKKFVVLYCSANGKKLGGYYLSIKPDGQPVTITEIAAKWESKPTR